MRGKAERHEYRQIDGTGKRAGKKKGTKERERDRQRGTRVRGLSVMMRLHGQETHGMKG